MCSHSLSPLKSLFISTGLRFRCTECNSIVYREHPKATLPLESLFFDRIGFVFIVIVISVIDYIAIFALVFILLTLALYITDVKNEPLQVFSKSKKDEYKKRDKELICVILVIVALAYISQFI